MSQETAILKHMKEGKTVTPLQAFGLFNCLRLAAAIFGLKQKGHQIEKTLILEKGHRVAEYTLIPPKP